MGRNELYLPRIRPAGCRLLFSMANVNTVRKRVLASRGIGCSITQQPSDWNRYAVLPCDRYLSPHACNPRATEPSSKIPRRKQDPLQSKSCAISHSNKTTRVVKFNLGRTQPIVQSTKRRRRRRRRPRFHVLSVIPIAQRGCLPTSMRTNICYYILKYLHLVRDKSVIIIPLRWQRLLGVIRGVHARAP